MVGGTKISDPWWHRGGGGGGGLDGVCKTQSVANEDFCSLNDLLCPSI